MPRIDSVAKRRKRKKTVIVNYDSMNYLVWVDGQVPKKPGRGVKKSFGKDARRFKDNRKTRAYAIKLAKQKNGRVYDVFFRKFI